MLFPNGAAKAADNCLTAPNSPAPQGSHWYYRIERPSLRKCWRLVQKDRKEQNAAGQTAPQGDADGATAAAPPPAASIRRHAWRCRMCGRHSSRSSATW